VELKSNDPLPPPETQSGNLGDANIAADTETVQVAVMKREDNAPQKGKKRPRSAVSNGSNSILTIPLQKATWTQKEDKKIIELVSISSKLL